MNTKQSQAHIVKNFKNIQVIQEPRKESRQLKTYIIYSGTVLPLRHLTLCRLKYQLTSQPSKSYL